VDPKLLDLLQYYNDIDWPGEKNDQKLALDMDKLNIFKWSKPDKKRISPVHLAHYQKQSISVNLIFRYMAKIERKNQ
jgi:hypothetical protein